MKILLRIIIILLLILPFIHGENYGVRGYGCGLYGIGCSETVPESPGGGSSGGGTIYSRYECELDSDCGTNQYCFNYTCHNAECFSDLECKEDESCYNHRCVKLFDMEILNFESPAKVGEFFNFTYFLKAVAEINGDVEIKFWIEKDQEIISTGQDTIYFGSYEEKIKNKSLFLPNDISSGTYIFHIQVTYGTYTAGAHRTIGIIKDGETAIIQKFPEEKDMTKYVIFGLILLAILVLFAIFKIERKRIKKQIMKKEKWFLKHKITILIMLLFIILGSLGYYMGVYEFISKNIPDFIIWIQMSILFIIKYGYYILGIILLLVGIILINRFFKRKKKTTKKTLVKKKTNKRKKKPKRRKKRKNHEQQMMENIRKKRLRELKNQIRGT